MVNNNYIYWLEKDYKRTEGEWIYVYTPFYFEYTRGINI